MLDLFAGIGGMSDGFHQAGCEILGGIEWDPTLSDLYVRNHRRRRVGVKVITKDVRKVALDEVCDEFGLEPGALTYLVGGSPCQGYSTIGKRQVGDQRNELMFEFPRFLRSLRPRAFVIENVPGFLNFDGGRALSRLMEELTDAGYENSRYQIVDATACGIPQRRQRVVIYGTRDSELPDFTKLGVPSKNCPTVWDAIGDLPDPWELMKTYNPGDKVPHLQQPLSKFAKKLRGQTTLVSHWEPVLHTKEIIAAYKRTEQGKTELNTKCWRLVADGQARTLRAGSRTRTACRPIHPYQPRVITVREAARLHSFPDFYIFPKGKSAAHVAIGNAVPPLLAKGLANEFNAALERGPVKGVCKELAA